MSHYFDHVSRELQSKIAQAKVYIVNHNPSTGAMAEAVLRQFLKEHLPGAVSVGQGFITDPSGGISKQCDILIYDSQRYAPFFRAEDVVVVPAEAVIAIIEVKTSINRRAFHDVIEYFASFKDLPLKAKTYLFMFNAPSLTTVSRHFHTFKHPGTYQQFDHDTYQFLPDEITGLDSSYHLGKSWVTYERDGAGYQSYFFKDSEGTEINALEHFFLSVYKTVETYIAAHNKSSTPLVPRSEYHRRKSLDSFYAIDLFAM